MIYVFRIHLDDQVQRECKLEVNVEEYVEATVRPYVMDVIYCWSKVYYYMSSRDSLSLSRHQSTHPSISLLIFLIYTLVQGANFGEVMEMTDIFEGSVIRLARRLDEFLNQVRDSKI